MSNGVGEELMPFVQGEAERLEKRATSFDSRVNHVTSLLNDGKARLVQLELKESEMVRDAVIKALKAHIAERKLTAEALFKAADKDEDGVITKADFAAFLEECAQGACPQEGDRVERLFALLDEAGAGSIPKDTLFRLVLKHYVVVKETVVTTEMAIKESKSIRRLDVEEIIEVHEGPLKDESSGVMRLRGRAIKDGQAGWTTVTGNTGTAFLEETSSLYIVTQALTLTSARAVATAETVQELRPGAQLEVLQWDTLDEASTTQRLKVKVKGGTAVGWVSRSGADGTPLIKLVR